MAPDGSVIIDTKIDTKELKSQLENVKKSLDDASKYYKSLGKEGASAFKEIETQFKKIDASAKISGDEIKALGDKKEVLQKKIDSLISSGLKPEDLQVKALKKTYDELTRAQTISSTAIEQKTKTLKQSIGNMKASLLGLTAAVTAGVVVISKLIKGVSDLDKAYKVQLMAERALEQASKNNPYLDSNSVNRLKAYASELQKVSNVGDEVSIGLMTQLASAGRTEAQIREMIKTAIDMEAAGFGTVEGNVRNLNKLFGGLTGELGEIIPELKNFTKEQLQNGEALDMLSKKYDGMAASVVDKSVQIQNALGDLKEVIGEIGTTSGLTDIFQNSLLAITEWYTSGLEMFNDWVKRMRGLKDYSLEVLRATREERYSLVKEERKAITEINEKLNNETNTNTKNLLTQALRQRMATLMQMEDGITMIDAEIAKKEKELAEANKKTIITTGEEITEAEKKQIEGRIAAQEQYVAAVNLATEKQKGGIITLEEEWELIKGAAETYTDALITLGYTYDETGTKGGQALDEMRRKLTGVDLSLGLGGNISGVKLPMGIFDTLVNNAAEEGDDAGKALTSAMASALDNTSVSVSDSIGGIVDNIGAAISIAVGVVKKIFAGIKAVAKFDPQAMYDSFIEIIDGLTKLFEKISTLPIYIESGKNILFEFAKGLIENREKNAEIFRNVLVYMLETAKEVIPAMISLALLLLTDFAVTIISQLPMIIDTAFAIITALATGILDALPALILAAGDILPALLYSIIVGIPSFYLAVIEHLPEIITAIINAVIGMLPELTMAIIQAWIQTSFIMPALIIAALVGVIVEVVANLVKDVYTLFTPAGEAIWQGIWQGIKDGWAKFAEDVRTAFKSIGDMFTDMFEINSPSKVFGRYGVNLMDGLKNSILGYDLWGQISGKFTELRDKVSNALAGMKDTASTVSTSVADWFKGLFNAEGTNNFRGGTAVINEEGAEMVTLPSGSKIMTARATAQMQDRAIAQLLSSTRTPTFSTAGSGGSRNINISTKVDAPLMIDGAVLGRLVFQNIDKAVV